MVPDKNQREQETALACDLTAIAATQREQHLSIAGRVFAAAQELRELPDGYALRLADSASNITLASEFIARERLCCPFFSFELVLEKERGPLWLQLRGREGVKAFIEAELNLKR